MLSSLFIAGPKETRGFFASVDTLMMVLPLGSREASTEPIDVAWPVAMTTLLLGL